MFKKIYKFIWDKLGWFFIGGVALASITLPEQANETADLNVLENTINIERQDNGKYKRRDKQITNGVEYEVHEYETAFGEIGYTIFITKEEDGMVYKKAISTGVQKEDREYDWLLIQDNSEVATTT